MTSPRVAATPTARVLVSDDQRRALMASRHRLDGSSTEPKQVDDVGEQIVNTVDALVVLHSSDPVTVYLSLLTRLPAVSIEAVADRLYESRDLVRVHGMRRTLWVGSPSVAADIVQACAVKLADTDRKRLARFLEQGGVTSNGGPWIDRAATEILSYITDHGPCDTRAIGDALPHLSATFDGAPGKKYSAKIAAHTRVLLLLGFQGRIVRTTPLGTWIASQYRWATPEQWLGAPLVDGDLSKGVSCDVADEDFGERERAAQRSMIERYLRRFGPVTEVDVVWWTGWTRSVVRRALGELGALPVELEGLDEPGWVAPDDDVTAGTEGGVETIEDWVAVLPGLDPTIMGWKQRQWYLADDMIPHLFDRNGNGGPSILVNGRVVGGWAQRDGGELVYEILADVGREAVAQIEAKLDSLTQRLGDQLFKVRFPNPLYKRLRD